MHGCWKGAPATVSKAFSVRLAAWVADAQYFGIHLNSGDEPNEEGGDAHQVYFSTTSLE